MTFHILTNHPDGKLVTITKKDLMYTTTDHKINIVTMESTPLDTIKKLSTLDFDAGDVICLAGLCPRKTTFEIIELAKERKENYLPGQGVDHRGVPIESGKIKNRLAVEKNHLTAWPFLAVIGDPESAKLSFEMLSLLEPELYWPDYVPDEPHITHLLAVLTATGLWTAPEWFKLVDLSIRDLELAPVMYASHMWHDWIAFYPANGNFKLENHSQLFPVWIADSEKPMEYWQYE